MLRLYPSGARTVGRLTDAFAAEFLELYARHGKSSTVESKIYMVGRYIQPAFGHVTVDAISLEQVRDRFACLADQPGIASPALPILSMMMRKAEPWRYRARNTDLRLNTKRYRIEPMDRYLAAE